MAKKSVPPPTRAARLCGLRGCRGTLEHGAGLGCDNAECTNYWKKWFKQPTPLPVDERASLLAAIAARKKKEKHAHR